MNEPILWAVNRYGWTFESKRPTAKALAELWAMGKATEVSVHVPGYREIRA